jgi:hypothetical protein
LEVDNEWFDGILFDFLTVLPRAFATIILARCVNDVDAVVDTGASNQLAVTVYNIDRESFSLEFLGAICPNPLNRMIVVFSSCRGLDENLNVVSICFVELKPLSAINYQIFASAFVSIDLIDVVQLDVVLQCS